MASATEVGNLIVRLIGDSSSYQNMLRGAVSKTRSAGLRITAGVTLPVLAAVKAFADFDQAMTQSTSIMNVTAKQTQEMRDLALDLSKTAVQGPEELARSYFYLASAGLDAAQSMEALPQVAKFATAGAFDMAKATDLLTDAASALGLEVADYGQLSDILVKANTLANASVEQFSVALTSKAGSAIKNFNIDLEDGVAVLAAFADQGIKAELAGNTMDRAVRLLAKAAKDNAAAWEEMGVAVFGADEEFRPFAQILADLESKFSTMSTEAKIAALETLGFEARTQQAILPLIGASEAIAKYRRELEFAQGTTAAVADKQMKSFTNQMKLLWNQIKIVAIEIGEALAPWLVKLTTIIGNAISWWDGLGDSTKKWIALAIGLVAAAGPLLLMLSALGTALGGLVTLVSTVGTVFTGLTAILGGPLVVIGGLIAVAGVLAFTIGALLANEVFGITKAFSDWNEQLTRTRQLSEELAEVTRKGTQSIIEQSRELADDPAQRQKALSDAIAQTEASIAGLNQQMAEHRATIHQSGSTWDTFKSSLKDSQKQAGVNVIGRMTSAITQTTRATAEHAVVTGTQRSEMAATKKQLEAMKARLAELKGEQELATKQAKQDQLQAAASKKAAKDAEMAKWAAAEAEAELARKTKEAEEAAQAQARAMQEQQSALQEAASLTQQYLTPQEKHAQAMEKLNKHLEAGRISQATYDRAVADANKTLNDAIGDDLEKKLKVDVVIGDNELLRFGDAQFRQLARGLLPGNPAGPAVAGLPGAINPAFLDGPGAPNNPNAPGAQRQGEENTDALAKIAMNTGATVEAIKKLQLGLEPANLGDGTL